LFRTGIIGPFLIDGAPAASALTARTCPRRDGATMAEGPTSSLRRADTDLRRKPTQDKEK